MLILVGLLVAGWKYRAHLRQADQLANDEPDSSASTSTAASTPVPAVATPALARPNPTAPAPIPAAQAQNATPTPAPSPVDPVELVKKHRDSLVFVSGGNGAGSGFIAGMNGRIFLITNAHVAAGVQGATFTTLQGTAVKAGASSVAVGHDIFAMETAPTATSFEVMRDVDTNARLNDDVVVLGNAEGGGVINTIRGRIVGFGPNLVEVTAEFQPGNSGSPIIHLKSGKVIGVATYLTVRKYDPATRQPVSSPVIRRFGYRLDSVKTWQPVNWAAFQAQARQIEAVEKLTGDFITFIQDIAPDGRVTPGRHTNPAIRSRIDGWLNTKTSQMSQKDRATADLNFISFLKSATVGDINNLRPQLTYDYFQRQLGEHQKERTEIADVFGQIVQRVQGLR